MVNIEKLENLIKEVIEVKNFGYGTPKREVLEDKILRYFKNEFTEKSDYYIRMQDMIKDSNSYSPYSTPDIRKHNYQIMLEKYKLQLMSYLEEFKEGSIGKTVVFSHVLDIHPKIVAVSESLFSTHHYSQAIFEALKLLEQEIKIKSGVMEIGKTLATKVFNENNPILKINAGQTSEDEIEREGFRFLFMGAFMGIKDPKSHANVKLEDPIKAIEYLAFISLLLRTVESSKI